MQHKIRKAHNLCVKEILLVRWIAGVSLSSTLHCSILASFLSASRIWESFESDQRLSRFGAIECKQTLMAALAQQQTQIHTHAKNLDHIHMKIWTCVCVLVAKWLYCNWHKKLWVKTTVCRKQTASITYTHTGTHTHTQSLSLSLPRSGQVGN